MIWKRNEFKGRDHPPYSFQNIQLMPLITSIGEILFDLYENDKKLGGAPFNFIYHIIKLTGKGNFISRIGNDDDGNEIRRVYELLSFKI